MSGCEQESDGDNPTSLEETTEGRKGGVKESEDGLRGMTGGCCWILYEALGELGEPGETLGLEIEGGTEIEKIKIFLGGIWRLHGNC